MNIFIIHFYKIRCTGYHYFFKKTKIMVYPAKNKNYSPFFIQTKRYAIENQKDIKSLKPKKVKKVK